jgi:hypothetical protein
LGAAALQKLEMFSGCDTFNRFHPPVIVHQKHEGAVTRHEFLPSSARKHLQLLEDCRPQNPLLTGSFLFVDRCKVKHSG